MLHLRTPAMKMATIKQLAGQHPVRKLCRTLGVARNAYHAAQKKGQRPRAVANARLGAKARELFEASACTDGSPRLRMTLRRAGRDLRAVTGSPGHVPRRAAGAPEAALPAPDNWPDPAGWTLLNWRPAGDLVVCRFLFGVNLGCPTCAAANRPAAHGSGRWPARAARSDTRPARNTAHACLRSFR